jgi:hypothetical protein
MIPRGLIHEYRALSPIGKFTAWASIASFIGLALAVGPTIDFIGTLRSRAVPPAATSTEPHNDASPRADAAVSPPAGAAGLPSTDVATPPTAEATGPLSLPPPSLAPPLDTGTPTIAEARGDGTIAGVSVEARDHAITIFNTGEGGVRFTEGNKAPHPDYPEPDAHDMKAALLHEMVRRGGTVQGDDTVSLELFGNGMALRITSLEKIGCRPALAAPGYVCDFTFSINPYAFTREAPSADARVDPGITMLLQILAGGSASNGVAHRRFVKGKERWMVITENANG